MFGGFYTVRFQLGDGVGRSVMYAGDYLGSYTSQNGRWKGQVLNQEHTAVKGENPVFGSHEVGFGFSGSCGKDGALLEATALAGKRSLRLTAVLKLMRRA